MTAALAQAGDRLDLPKGADASRCCSCDGVVTFAPTGRCVCPVGGAETRAAAQGCQAATETFRGREHCASACREIFWGKAKASHAAEKGAEAAEATPSAKKSGAEAKKDE